MQPKDTEYMNHLANCPEHWETNGIDRVIKAYKKTQCKLHIANLSSAAAINKIYNFRRKYGDLISTETCAHYLFFTNEAIEDKATEYKDSPPIRNKKNCNLLWECLKLKLIDVISSKHAYILKDYKFEEEGSFKRAVSGVNTLGYTL